MWRVCVCVCVCVCVFVCVVVAMLWEGVGQLRPVNRGQLPTNELHDINWGALNKVSRAPQMMSCNYHIAANFQGSNFHLSVKVTVSRRKLSRNAKAYHRLVQHTQILWRKVLWAAPKPQTLWMFCSLESFVLYGVCVCVYMCRLYCASTCACMCVQVCVQAVCSEM